MVPSALALVARGAAAFGAGALVAAAAIGLGLAGVPRLVAPGPFRPVAAPALCTSPLGPLLASRGHYFVFLCFLTVRRGGAAGARPKAAAGLVTDSQGSGEAPRFTPDPVFNSDETTLVWTESEENVRPQRGEGVPWPPSDHGPAPCCWWHARASMGRPR